jgi:hypothetical protein
MLYQKLLFWGIGNVVTGQRVIILPQFFGLIVSPFLSVLQSNVIATLNKAAVKSTFCQGVIPPDETTIISPPSGDPNAPKDEYWFLQKTLYGLCHSPCHWYEPIDSILFLIGFTPNPHDPCFYTGFVHDPCNVLTVPLTVP